MAFQDFLSSCGLKDVSRVFTILDREELDDIAVLRRCSEDDLLKCGLKMGEVKKIKWKLEEIVVPASEGELMVSLPKEPPSCGSFSVPGIVCFSNTSKFETPGRIYSSELRDASPEDLLSKKGQREKGTRSQKLFVRLLRDCANSAGLWRDPPELSTIPQDKWNLFFNEIDTAAPCLASHHSEVRQRLGQMLVNRRKYQRDLNTGKRKLKQRGMTENQTTD
ncbi:predicted protein [Nematostella vectensis]|uniref:SAM domain-containing protein n=1 Tax=Nematostella vectensis TaxID=45351 RepID=A7S5Q8_NEMVE|nr:uncharacterized protein LOC5512662 [Nematostella vectensis]EDO40947.1 predicted protein [Nematostella vectensis]|eukprot:XP_001633010.1 predicted protein [Nematostella vectensis]